MAFKVMFVLALALAAVLAADGDPKREKKAVFAYGAYPYAAAYDDGSYYPGKYEKTAYYAGAVPYAAAAISPYAYTGAYPYAYGAYPYAAYHHY